MKPIGERIREKRKRDKLSAEDVAMILGLKKENIYKWEKGSTPSDPEQYLKLESWLNGKLENVPHETLNEPAASYEKLSQANVFLEESVRNLTQTQMINAKSIERLIELLESKLSSQTSNGSPATFSHPGTTDPNAEGVTTISGKKKKTDK